VFFLATPLLVIIGHFLLVPVYLGWAGKDVWIGILAGFVLGSVIFVAMASLQQSLYGQTLIERLLQRLGPWFGRIVSLPLILYFFALSAITLYGFSVFISSAFSLNFPQWVVTFTFTLLIVYMVNKGIEVIARVAEWILFYNILSGIMVSLSLINKKDYAKLLPMLDHGVEAVIPVVLYVIAVFGELIVMLMVNVKRNEQGESISYRMVYFLLFLANLIIFPSTSVSPVAIFGEEQAKHMTFPVESAVRVINLGFIERFDVYGLTIMTVSSSLRLALLHYATCVGLSQWMSFRSYRLINVVVGGLLMYTSMNVFDHYMKYLVFLKEYYVYGMGASGLILLLWMVTAFANRKKKRQHAERTQPSKEQQD
jgi:spore germination protein KB